MPLPPGWDESTAINLGGFAEVRAEMRDHLRAVHGVDASRLANIPELNALHSAAHEREGTTP
jgi:hypothetical protein